MKGKVLFIDYVYQKGHVNFNRIHIDAIRTAGYDVKIVLHSDIASQLDYPASDYVAKLPRFLNMRGKRAVLNRIIFTVTLLYLKFKIRFSDYSHVVVSSCDEVTLGLLPLCRNMYIVCHNTGTVASRVKLFFLKRLARRNTFVVFDDYMKKPLLENGITNVAMVSHGCVSPFDESHADTNLPKYFSAFRKVVFHPSSKTDDTFVNSLVNSGELADFLVQNDVLLLIHGDKKEGEKYPDNVRFISGFLPTALYRKIFLRSDIVLLAYPSSFQNQVSGVSFECVANRKNMLVLEHPALHYCRDFYNYDPIFSTTSELVEKMGALTRDSSLQCVATPESLTPDYHKILG